MNELQAAESEARALANLDEAMRQMCDGSDDCGPYWEQAKLDYRGAVRATEAARYRGLVAGVRAALARAEINRARLPRADYGAGAEWAEVALDTLMGQVRAALAVITEPVDGNSTVQG